MIRSRSAVRARHGKGTATVDNRRCALTLRPSPMRLHATGQSADMRDSCQSDPTSDSPAIGALGQRRAVEYWWNAPGFRPPETQKGLYAAYLRHAQLLIYVAVEGSL